MKTTTLFFALLLAVGTAAFGNYEPGLTIVFPKGLKFLR